MLTVLAMSGKWKARRIPELGFGGSAWGLLSEVFSIIWVVPDVGGTLQSLPLKGSIVNGPMNNMRDRDCTHYDGDGFIWYFGDHMSKTIVNPVGSSYVGPPIRLEKFTVPCTGYDNDFTAAGMLMNELTPFTIRFPDHSYTDNSREFRNCYVKYVVDGLRMRYESHWEQRKIGDSKWDVYESIGSWVTFDFVNRTYTPEGSYTRSLLTMAKTTLVSLPSITSFHMEDWVAAFHRASQGSKPPDRWSMWGDLCRRCANDAQALDLNSIEFLSELPSLIPDLKRVLSLLKGKASLKSASKLFLSYKYGTPLTVKDFITILKGVPRVLYHETPHLRWTRAAESVSVPCPSAKVLCRDDLYHYKIYYDPMPDGLKQFVNETWGLGLFPSLQNSWDLIPMSFVVDWVANISERLQAFDAATFWSTCNVLNTCGSQKTILSGVLASGIFTKLGNCSGTITLYCYSRWTSPTVVKPTFFTTDAPRKFHNYAEATALLISRSKRLK